jgi:hypothetical protein
MAGLALNLPIDIPWTLLSASPDMMSPKELFGERGFPSPWRTSIAIAAYEPPDEFQELIDCGQRISLLKVTCTLAGYTPTADEVANGWTYLPPDTVKEVWAIEILGPYFACYGALVNVSVFPKGGPKGTVARVLDFEPKVRDLYQAATEGAEILSGSAGEVNTTKGWTKTSSTETGLGHTGKYTSPQSEYGQLELSHYVTGKWGHTDKDSSQTTVDASRDRRERFSSSTNISQLYNLLTGYHAGTNRAAFLLLPRPHTKQPTNRRTFVQGVRVIEGVQEFFLVVARPTTSEGLCVEVTLDTGHYPEDVSVATPEIPHETKEIPKNVTAYAGTSAGGGPRLPIDWHWDAPAGWVIDRFNPGCDQPPNFSELHEGMKEGNINDNQQALDSLSGYEYSATSDTRVEVNGTIQGQTVGAAAASFDRDYVIYIRPEVLKPSTADDGRVTSKMLIVNRSLAACYVVDKNGCLRAPDGNGPEIAEIPHIANEFEVEFAVAATAGNSLGVPPSEIIRNTQRALVAAPLMPSRREPGTTTFLASDVFAGRLAPLLSQELRQEPASASPEGVTVDELLTSSTLDLFRKYGMSPTEVARARHGTLEGLAGRRSDAAQR